jgi:hypothetical protein
LLQSAPSGVNPGGQAALQSTGFDPLQTPSWQASVCVQASRSLQLLVSLFVWLHAPVAATHVSSVHELSSLQALVSVKTQPVLGLHISAVQRLWSSHVTGVPWQVPPAHVSPDVQELKSLHGPA